VMTAHAVLSRRAALVLSAIGMPLLLAGCAGEEVLQVFPPLTYGYLTKLRLDVATIDVAEAWTPAPVPNGEHVEDQSPVQPVEALRRMVQDRLVPAGASGSATVTIDDASLVRQTDRFEAAFAVHMDIHNADGTRTGYAEARVARTRTITDYAPPAVHQALYDLVKATMNDMNVEFEYQIRRSLKDWLQTSAPAAPVPPPVEQQPLGTPPKS